MKNRILVGAAGLALAGVAIAQDAVIHANPSARTDAFTKMRDAAVGTSGSAQRNAVIEEIRQGVADGTIDPKRVLLDIPGLFENLGGTSRIDMSNPLDITPTETGIVSGSGVTGVDNFNGYTPTSFVNPPNSLVGFGGQPNPFGFVPGAAFFRYGAANDAIMTNTNVGNPGGVAPVPGAVAPDQYGGFFRRTALDPRRTGFFLGQDFFHPVVGPSFTPGDTFKDVSTAAARAGLDFYYLDASTLNAWQISSTNEGFIADRVFFGGTQQTGAFGFFSDANDEMTSIVTLGPLAGNFEIGQFYAVVNPEPPYQFPVNQWFKLMGVIQHDLNGALGYGLFVKPLNADGTPTYPGLTDPRMTMGMISPIDGDPSGWVNTYPGLPVADGGIGVAQTQFALVPPMVGEFGNPGELGLAGLIAALSLNRQALLLGIDPGQALNPGFAANDIFFDNLSFAGTPVPRVCPLPDFILPYRDRFDFYTVNQAIRPQTNRWFDALSSNAAIINFGGGRNLINQNFNNDNIFREEDTSTIPTFPLFVQGEADAPGMRAIAEARLLFNSLADPPLVSRGVRVTDGLLTGNLSSVILGARDENDPFQSADGTVWVRQPNIGAGWSQNPPVTVWGDGVNHSFDENVDAQDNELQINSMPDTTLNTQFINIQAAVGSAGGPTLNVPANTFFTVRMEFFPNPDEDANNPFDDGLMRVFIGGSEIFNPSGDPWVAGGFTISNVEFWSGNDAGGLGEGLLIEDLQISGPIFTPVPGPAFTNGNYNDDFESYPTDRTIDGQGDTPFRSLGSTPDQATSDNARKLTFKTAGVAPIADGTLVCRYEIVELCVDAVDNLAVNDIIAVNFDALADPFNTFEVENTDCPGVSGLPIDFVSRPDENMARIEEGRLTLLNPGLGTGGGFPFAAVPFDSGTMSGEDVGIGFSATTITRWGVGGVDQRGMIREDPTDPANKVLVLTSTAGIDGTTTDNPMTGVIGSTLPISTAAAENFPSPATTVEMSWRMYIEDLDVNGAPNSPAQAPRSRMEVAIVGGGADNGRITNINFGGPNVNAVAALDPVLDDIADDLISYTIPSGLANPDIKRVATPNNVSVVSGGGGISGPLVNTWFDCIFVLNADSTWEFYIDEGAGRVLVANDVAIDVGNIGLDAPNPVDTFSIDSFNVNVGFDVGSGGEAKPTPFRIRTLVRQSTGTNWDAEAPSNANPSFRGTAEADLDYCFYDTDLIEEQAPAGERARIANVNGGTGAIGTVRDLSANSDVIAVINRAYDPVTNTISGPKIQDPCPINLNAPLNQVEIFAGEGQLADDGVTPIEGNLLFFGRWGLQDQPGQAGINNPSPAGGISRPDGPFASALSYNNPAVQPLPFPADLVARPIIIAQWGEDLADEQATGGRDPLPARLPRARWFFDDLSIKEIAGSACFGDLNGSGAVDGIDLLTLLNDFGNGPNGNGNPLDNPAADINGDGVVNGGDLLILLSNNGPCPV